MMMVPSVMFVSEHKMAARANQNAAARHAGLGHVKSHLTARAADPTRPKPVSEPNLEYEFSVPNAKPLHENKTQT